METEELLRLFNESNATVDRIRNKYLRGRYMTRKDANDLRIAVQRVGVCAREIWIQMGKPEGFEGLRAPIPLSPLPSVFSAHRDN